MTQETLPPKPLPTPDFDTEPFWTALKEHELRLQRCADCEKAYFYPRSLCPHCWSDNVQWERMSGRGTVYTYTIVRRAPHRAFTDDVPFVIAVVELEEGPRMPVNLVDCPVDDVRVEMAVEIVFEDINDEITMPRFRPIGG
ncbi:MAG TPA: Zn-ribbon domain-containing OB-fold protein [Dehalococcoidia bacterium]|nr:Zn-ribbon domain-containing OB-fold protein [Dehalococcoidia bacterium]